jgi:hypothetical protein
MLATPEPLMMLSTEECRKRSAQCLELAMSASGDERKKFLDIAKAWLVLADAVVAVNAPELPSHRVRPAKRAA